MSEDVLEVEPPRFGRLQKSDVEGTRRDYTEARERRKDRERQKKKKESDLPEAVMQMNRYSVHVCTCACTVHVQFILCG